MTGRLRGAVLVTGNENKLAEARRLAGPELESVAIDLPEIQSLDLEKVLRAKGAEAWARLGRPLIVEETGLELAALNGFPGPLVKWLLHSVGDAGIARIAHALGDFEATARCALLWTADGHAVVAEGSVSGRLITPPRGDGGFGWDPVFQPDGSDLTYGEMPDEAKDATGHRGKAWRALLDRLAV